MANNPRFIWKVNNMEAIMSYSSLTNVVRAVYWQCEGHDDDNKYGTHWGVQQLEVDNINPDNYTNYNDLTEAQVIEWVKNSLNSTVSSTYVAELEASILEEMESEDRGSRITGTPWS